MDKNVEKDKNKDCQELENARLGYETAIHMFSLASQEFYSRFAAMLIAHALFLTVIFRYQEVNKCVAILAAFVGFALSVLWLLLAKQSMACQDYYCKKAAELEENFNGKFRIFSRKGCTKCALLCNIAEENKFLKKPPVTLPIDISSVFIIIIFLFIFTYSYMLYKIIN